jgi:hypothetical protein
MRAAYHNNIKFGAILSLILALFLLMAPARSLAEETSLVPDEKIVTITGSVEKAAIDEKGAVIAVEIWVVQGDTYDYYLVNDTPEGSAVIALVGSKITATGILEEDEDGNKILTVKSYSPQK